MHELAANAAVHGALSHSEGSLTINWRQAEDDGLIIEWDELSKRNAEPRKGFGTILLSAVLEKQLGGKISREWRDRGLHIAVELPALNRVGASLRSKPWQRSIPRDAPLRRMKLNTEVRNLRELGGARKTGCSGTPCCHAGANRKVGG